MPYIAFIMIVIKMTVDFFVFVIKKINCRRMEELNSDEASCIHCQLKDDIYTCTHILFKWKMNKNICPRKKCWGFNTGQSKVDDNTTLVNVPWLLAIKKAVDLFPEFAAALLALNEIISR